MDCKYCGKKVVLVPSATERVRKYGGKPSDYTKLFPYHAVCFMRKREGEVYQLMLAPIKGRK